MEEEIDMSTHGYNLRPRPTKRNRKSNMVSIGQQSTIAKPHLHVMLNQVGIREGLKEIRRKGKQCTTERSKPTYMKETHYCPRKRKT